MSSRYHELVCFQSLGHLGNMLFLA